MNEQDKHETDSIVIIDVEMEGNALYSVEWEILMLLSS